MILNNLCKPFVILFGASQYRNYINSTYNERSLSLIRRSLSQVTEKSCFRETVNRDFSRPQVLFDLLPEDPKANLVFLYFFGQIMNRRDGKLYFAHPASNSKKTSTHIHVDEIIEKLNPSKSRKILIFIDAEVFPRDLSVRYRKHVLFVIRRLKNSRNVWRNGGELFSGCFSETLINLHQVLPSITFRQLFSVIAHRLGYGYPENCVLLQGDTSVFDEQVFLREVNSGLWFSERQNLESENRGSREDGIQILIGGLGNIEMRDDAVTILEFLASTDPADEVRRAAKGLLPFSMLSRIRASEPIKIYEHIESLLPEWIFIPAGDFIMGSDPKQDNFALPEEMPVHELWLPDFWIARTPVTKLEWEKFVNRNHLASDSGTSAMNVEDFPVTGINWYEATEYARWLTAQCSVQGIIRPDEEIRLPSEAEWEKAARGSDGRIYPWGMEFKEDFCNYRSTPLGSVAKSGMYSPRGDSPYGVQDMAGNVWDWTISLWGQGGHKPEFGYPYARNDGRENQFAGSETRRVVRGGAFYYFDYCLRAATRNVMYPATRHSGGGFRLVKVQKNGH